MAPTAFRLRRPTNKGVTIAEVAIASALVAMGLGGIFTLSSQSLQLLKSARQSTAASQILQQRAENIRLSSWTTLSKAPGLTTLMQTAVSAESDIGDVSNLIETVTVSTFAAPGAAPAPSAQSFAVSRTHGTASSGSSLDLSSESQLKFAFTVTWDDRTGPHQHDLSTVVSSGGISAGGISNKNNPSIGTPKASSTGSATPSPSATPIPTPAPSPSATPTPTPTPAPTATPTPTPSSPTVCKHGRAWPHCGQP